MNEKEPQYFKEFREGIKGEFKGIKGEFEGIKGEFEGIKGEFERIDVRFEKIDGKLGKIDEIIEKQDMLFETLGELKVQVTGIELTLRKKADHQYVQNIETRTEKLEKAIFA